MGIPIKILLIEDSEDDALFLLRELRKGGYDPDYQRVDKLDVLSTALVRKNWDIVITDYSLPGFSGIAALEIVEKQERYIPAIMVSGKMGETSAVEAMKAGANDYIIKGNYTRLIPAIERELREAIVHRERQAALEELRRSETRYRAVVEDQTELINRYTPDGVITFANTAYARLFDLTPEEIIGMRQEEFLSKESYTALQASCSKLSKETPIMASEHRRTTRNGEIVWLQWHDRIIFDSAGNVVEYQGVGRDITELKNAELELKTFANNLERYATQLQVAAEIARDAATASNLDSLLKRAVDLVREYFGFYHAAVFLLDDAGEFAVLETASGESGELLLEQKHKLKVGKVGIVGHVAMSGQPRIALDVGKDATHFRQPLLPYTRSELAVPLKVMDRIIGVFDVQSHLESAFDGNDLIVLQTLADQLAIAIDNMRLVQETKRRTEELAGLYDIALATNGVLDTQQLLHHLYDYVRKLIDSDAFSVALYTPNSREYKLVMAMENNEPVTEFLGKMFPISSGFTGWVLREGKPLLIGDILNDPLPIQPIQGAEPIRSWLGVPLIARDQLIGNVSIQSFRPNVFDISHQRFWNRLHLKLQSR